MLDTGQYKNKICAMCPNPIFRGGRAGGTREVQTQKLVAQNAQSYI